MSSAADELPSGDDPSANSVLTGTIGFLNTGGNLGTLLQGAIFGTLVSVFTGGIDIIQSIVGLVTAPINAAGEATIATIDATLIEPLGIVESGAEASASSIASQFGPFAFLVGLAILLAGFWLITQFLEEDETSNTFIVPGFPDLPFIGVEEEDED
jgi:hypothetical protein